MRTIKDEFNSRYENYKYQLQGASPLANSFIGFGTAGIVSSVGSLVGAVMMGAGALTMGPTIVSLSGLAAFGIVIATFFTGGEIAPKLGGAVMSSLTTPFTLAAKAFRSKPAMPKRPEQRKKAPVQKSA